MLSLTESAAQSAHDNEANRNVAQVKKKDLTLDTKDRK